MEQATKRELSLYVHIPFCKDKCNYCDFLSFGGCDYSRQKQYVNALCREIEAYKAIAEDYEVKTIFFGGGTPSYIEATFIEQIMQSICKVFDLDCQAEITIEGNPDSLTRDKLEVYRRVGVNRLSIGLQSANDELLKVLGRVHNYDQFIAAYSSARQAGFSNINVDLMSGLPGETKESYVRTLAKVVELQPEHISAYSLIVEEGTPLCDNEELLSMLPSEEMDRQLYAKTKMLLKNSGYNRYEISNYSKTGYECRHNLVYWTGGEYLGVGLGASSYLTVWLEDEHCERIRFHGVENMEEYIGRFSKCDGMIEDSYTDTYHFYEEMNYDGMLWEDEMDTEFGDNDKYEEKVLLVFLRDYYKDLHFLKRKEVMEEFMFLGLRCSEGISKQEFHSRFQVSIESVYGKIISKYVTQGLLIEQEDHIYLSDAGIDVSNVVMAEFLL